MEQQHVLIEEFMSKYQKIKSDIFKEIGCSDWLKRAIEELDERDVVDALHDIEALTQVFEQKWREIKGNNK